MACAGGAGEALPVLSSFTNSKIVSSSPMLGAEDEALVVVEGATSAAVGPDAAFAGLGGLVDVSGGR